MYKKKYETIKEMNNNCEERNNEIKKKYNQLKIESDKEELKSKNNQEIMSKLTKYTQKIITISDGIIEKCKQD
jgi:hypothetical protein